MAQIAAGGPTGLMGVGVDGGLFALPLDSGAAQLMADNIDAGTPLASGHGRIAARRRDGALWVLEAGRAGVSVERTLAPAAGLLVLPLAVIAVASEGLGQRAIRLEPTGSGAWRSVAQSAASVMPDARPLLADLDGSGDGGQVVMLAGPDSERYKHGVLGDAVEATSIVVLERHGLKVMRELVVDAPQVFEDIAPRKVALGSRDGLLTVRSGPQGAQLVLVDADPASVALLRVAASGPALGQANRWLSPITDGRRWMAVHTPHLGGVLHEYRRDGNRLVPREVLSGVSNHRIGSRQLDVSAWQGQRLLISDAGGLRLWVIDAASTGRVVGEYVLASRVAAMAGLSAAGGVALLLDDGSVSLASAHA